MSTVWYLPYPVVGQTEDKANSLGREAVLILIWDQNKFVSIQYLENFVEMHNSKRVSIQ